MMVQRIVLALGVMSASVTATIAADALNERHLPRVSEATNRDVSSAGRSYRGRVAVIDGRTLWFPEHAARIRLLDTDACELPQWAFDPKWDDRDRTRAPPPVPCGPLAKSWLKRAIGVSSVECTFAAYDRGGVPLARCFAEGRDLALEMLRVGWARVSSPYPTDGRYLAYQHHAMAARYGMWATYVLDMDEWRQKAIDKTLSRRPVADFNLLGERESEISPPFAAAKNKPARNDR